jgi:hypothetical protein
MADPRLLLVFRIQKGSRLRMMEACSSAIWETIASAVSTLQVLLQQLQELELPVSAATAVQLCRRS